MSEPDLEQKVAFLQRPQSYPEPTSEVETVETHMSWVFLTERHAYKLKKPVRHEHLDFTTLERRRHDCAEEVRLNRRLAPDVYRGMLGLTLAPGKGLALGGGGRPVDWLVWMRRLPAGRMLDVLIERDAVARADVRAAAEKLARFYAQAPPAGLASPDYRARLEKGVHRDRDELARPEFGLAREQVEALADRQLAFLGGRAGLLDERVRECRIVEGHGDLRPEHICLVDEPAIIDCLEFSQELRTVDAADELAFLALECERLGAPAVGRWFLDAYRERCDDRPPAALMRFYRSYRAMRRATLAVWHLDDAQVDDHRKWRARAGRYLELADPPPG